MSIVARMKILPKAVETDRAILRESVEKNLGAKMSLRGWKDEPIAFGLVALLLDIKLEDRDGAIDELESLIRGVDGVSEVEILGLSKLSTKIG